jgi:hypothetical protein
VPTDDIEGLWQSVEKAGARLTEPCQGFLRLQGLDDDWRDARSAAERCGVVERVVEIVGDLQLSGLLPDAEDTEMVANPGADERWPLLRDLIAARRRELPKSSVAARDWAPLMLTRVVSLADYPLISHRIEISIDARLPLRSLKRELDALWQRLGQQRWVKRSRPIGPRGIALIRFVCFEGSREVTWRERLDAWNAKFPKATKADVTMRFDDVRAFQKAFRRHEKQLTGHAYGLAWFYDEFMRQWLTRKPGSPVVEKPTRQQVVMMLHMISVLHEAEEPRRAAELLEALDEAQRTAAFDGDSITDEEEEEIRETFDWEKDDFPDPSLGDWRIDP